MTHPSAADVLTRSVSGTGVSRVVTLDPRFQGLPDTAHGGAVLALFNAVAEDAAGARSVAGIYRRRVPLATPLQLAIERDGASTRLRLSDAATTLVEGTVLAASDGPASLTAPAPPTGAALPLSTTCFACGVDNALGLRAELAIDDATVGGVWRPREEHRLRDTIAPVAVTTLLDEAAFWLGAAASGEAGMTTDLRVRLHGPVGYGRLLVAGSRAAVTPRADDARYWDTEIAAWDEAGTCVASATITFVTVRGSARKLVAGLLAMNPPEILRRVFPAYVR